MKIENTKIQMRKGILEFCVLHVISRGEIYVSDLIEELKKAKMVVVEGTLYPLLTRLKNAGMLEYKWIESSSGPPRKYYLLTDEGKKALTELAATWKDLHTSTNKIISNTSNTAVKTGEGQEAEMKEEDKKAP